jgi:hypothetical protein
MHKEFQLPPQVKIQRIQIWREWRRTACSIFGRTFKRKPPWWLSVSRCVKYAGLPVTSIIVDNSNWIGHDSILLAIRITCWYGHFSCFGMWNLCLKFVCTFQLYTPCIDSWHPACKIKLIRPPAAFSPVDILRNVGARIQDYMLRQSRGPQYELIVFFVILRKWYFCINAVRHLAYHGTCFSFWF